MGKYNTNRRKVTIEFNPKFRNLAIQLTAVYAPYRCKGGNWIPDIVAVDTSTAVKWIARFRNFFLFNPWATVSNSIPLLQFRNQVTHRTFREHETRCARLCPSSECPAADSEVLLNVSAGV